jgi:hypothetical protein
MYVVIPVVIPSVRGGIISPKEMLFIIAISLILTSYLVQIINSLTDLEMGAKETSTQRELLKVLFAPFYQIWSFIKILLTSWR